MKAIDLTDFLKETETPETRAYDHALDIEFAVIEEMLRQNLTKKELADRMGISLQRLSKLLNGQPNMTLKTIAMFELALGMSLVNVNKIHADASQPYVVTTQIDNWQNRIRDAQHNNAWSKFELINGGMAA